MLKFFLLNEILLLIELLIFVNSFQYFIINTYLFQI